MTDTTRFALETIFDKVCVLVTAAIALGLSPDPGWSKGSLLSMPDRGTKLLVFLLLGLVEEATVGKTGWFNHRIVAVCAAVSPRLSAKIGNSP